ncbi:hypothetical protein HOA55_02410 [archaeon]|jgi:hypothetical protein|nr:hypothetical protein [archaeon]MBT3577831.1 hypothetical protein [archaeon]MBT6820182.1 hypothetical protein [archaeon]MBT6955787.1 hypothetical protein [archaeon]MBT7025293.1 hypothetical protein [archaeon]
MKKLIVLGVLFLMAFAFGFVDAIENSEIAKVINITLGEGDCEPIYELALRNNINAVSYDDGEYLISGEKTSGKGIDLVVNGVSYTGAQNGNVNLGGEKVIKFGSMYGSSAVVTGVKFCMYSSEGVDCTDGDGGRDKNVKGTTEGLDSEGDFVSREDYCTNMHGFSPELDSCSGDNCGVQEFECFARYGNPENIEVGSLAYFCPRGCEDGACVGDSDGESGVDSEDENGSSDYETEEETGLLKRILNWFKGLFGG